VIPFTGWRSVGLAMRWARTQPCVTLQITESPDTIQYEWRNGEHGWVAVATWDDSEVRAGTDQASIVLHEADAATILNVLADLQLIPINFSNLYQQGRAHGATEAVLEVAEAFTAGRQQWAVNGDGRPGHKQAHGHDYIATGGGICAAITTDDDGAAYQCGRRP